MLYSLHVLERWGREQRTKGNKAAADLARVLRDHYGDIPLPSVEIPTRGPFTKELQVALQKESLTAIYRFTGETIGDQKEKGRKFWYITSADDNSVLAVHSLAGDVAVDPRPDKFFLPRSNKLTLTEQLEMVAEYSYKLQRRLKTTSVEAILGQGSDYSSLAFAHLDRTDERLFGENYGFDYTRTQTLLGESLVALVGHFNADHGLHVYDSRRDDRVDGVWAAPLVVRAAAVGR